VLARDRQARERGAAVHAGGVHAVQDAGKRAAVPLRVRDLDRQRGHLLGLALRGRSGFKGVEEFVHGGVCV
jgi:hypothetical protein